jgi:hypothetical protein
MIAGATTTHEASSIKGTWRRGTGPDGPESLMEDEFMVEDGRGGWGDDKKNNNI